MQHLTVLLVLGLQFLLAFGTVSAQSRLTHPDCGDAPFVVRNVRVFDGEKVLPAADVYVSGTRIAAVGTGLRLPGGIRSCDAAGFTLMPGLIDGHTHINDRTNLAEALLFGVTTELDMFANIDTIAAIRKANIARGGNTFADFRTAGTLVTTAGGHGTQFGFSIPTLQSPDSAQKFIDHRLAEGSNYIKIVYDNGSEWGFIGPMLDSATMRAAILAARRRGVLSIVHIGSYAGARTALEAGADAIAHVFADSMPDPGFGALVASHKAFVMTTLTPIGQLSTDSTWGLDRMLKDSSVMSKLDPGQDSSLDERLSPPARANMQVARAVVQQLRAANVPVVAGSDSPAPGTAHGITLHLELRNMVRAGFTPIEALRSATSVPAGIFGLNDRGRIQPGMRSDLLLIDGDPTTDINATFLIASVWKRGKIVNRTAPANVTQNVTAMVPTTMLKGRASSLRKSAKGIEFRPPLKVMAPPPFFRQNGIELVARGESDTVHVAFVMDDGTSVQSRTFIAPPSWTSFRFSFEELGVTATGRVVAVRFNPANEKTRSFDIYQVRIW